MIEREPLGATGVGLGQINRERGIEVTAETCLPGWGSEPGDIAYVADVALANRNVDLRKNAPADPFENPAEGRPGPDP